MTLACLKAAEVDLDLCCDGDLEFVGAEHDVLFLFSWWR